MVSTPASAATAATRQLERALGRDLAIRRVRLDALHLDPANARAHPERNLQSIQDSLARFGQVEPLIVLKSTGRVIGGNGRLVAMKALGWSECDIVELELSEIEATALGIALNRTAELAEWDDGALAQILDTLRGAGALEGLGFDGARLTCCSGCGRPRPDAELEGPSARRSLPRSLTRLATSGCSEDIGCCAATRPRARTWRG